MSRDRMILPSAEDNAFLTDLKDALAKHPEMDAANMMAVAAQFVGHLLAFQDQRRFTPEAAMQTVLANIEIGNHAAIESLWLGQPRGRA